MPHKSGSYKASVTSGQLLSPRNSLKKEATHFSLMKAKWCLGLNTHYSIGDSWDDAREWIERYEGETDIEGVLWFMGYKSGKLEACDLNPSDNSENSLYSILYPQIYTWKQNRLLWKNCCFGFLTTLKPNTTNRTVITRDVQRVP